MRRKLAYIAGPMTPRGNRTDTGNAAIEYLLNVRDLIHAAHVLIDKGYAPYCPGIDFPYYLGLPQGKVISEEAIKDVSMAFLDASDLIVLLPGWTASAGCRAEERRAVELRMPMFYGVESVPDAT